MDQKKHARTVPVIVSNFNYFYNRETCTEDLDSINLDHVKACPYWPDTSNRYEVRRLSVETSKELAKYPLSRRESDLSTWDSRIADYLLKDKIQQESKIEALTPTTPAIDFLTSSEQPEIVANNDQNNNNSTNAPAYCINCINRFNALKAHNLPDYSVNDSANPINSPTTNVNGSNVNNLTTMNSTVQRSTPNNSIVTRSTNVQNCLNCSSTTSECRKQIYRQFSKEFRVDTSPTLNATTSSTNLNHKTIVRTESNSLINLEYDDGQARSGDSFVDKRTRSTQELNPVDSTNSLVQSCSCNSLSIKEKHHHHHLK